MIGRERQRWLAYASALLLLLLLARLCHLDILWAEEAYPSAAAAQVALGKVLYRDIWFDKPPLYAWVYLLWGAQPGWPLRVAGALYCCAVALVTRQFALELGGAREGWLAGALLAFFLTFDLPSGILALAPDALLLLPHVAAVWLAWRGQAFASGVAAGIGLQANAKATLVMAACLLWRWRQWPQFLTGVAVPTAIVLSWLAWQGALLSYWQQVWEYGFVYSAHPFLAHPWQEGLLRTLNWMGFHAALAVGVVWLFRREPRTDRRWAFWLLLSLAAVAAGLRFFPRYYLHLLPASVLLGARGLVLLPGRYRPLALALLLIPLLRFGPRYVTLANDLMHGRPHQWGDVRLNQDSRALAQLIRQRAHNHDSLFVWGYRPDIYVYAGLPAGTPFLDSQPLTGVLADRHLTSVEVTTPLLAEVSRSALIKTEPVFLVDGLGPFNPALAITRYPDLQPWLQRYREVARTEGGVIYERRP